MSNCSKRDFREQSYLLVNCGCCTENIKSNTESKNVQGEKKNDKAVILNQSTSHDNKVPESSLENSMLSSKNSQTTESDKTESRKITLTRTIKKEVIKGLSNFWS